MGLARIGGPALIGGRAGNVLENKKGAVAVGRQNLLLSRARRRDATEYLVMLRTLLGRGGGLERFG